jgi:hypothetical protein
LKTAFDLPINFENEYSWRYSILKVKAYNKYLRIVIQDEFRIIVKPFEMEFICTADYYVPDLSNKNTDFIH